MNRFEGIEFQLLEARQLMAAVPLTSTTATFGTGTQLRITGTASNDTININFDGSNYILSTGTGYSQSFSGNYNSLRILGGKGNDIITIASNVSIPTYLLGEDGNDQLNGGSDDDVLVGGAGNDTLYGNNGRDTLVNLGGGTSDVAYGGNGNDFFWVDNNATEKLMDVSTDETAMNAVNKVTSFETSIVKNGTKSTTQAISKEITSQKLNDPTVSTSTFAYKDFRNNPLFASDGPSMDDIQQGQIGDCYFLATLSATASVSPNMIRTMVADLGDGTYAVRFTNAANATKYYRVDGDLPTYNASSNSLAYAKQGTENSLWVAIVEKAFTFQRRNDGKYASINGGWMTESLRAVGGKASSSMSKAYSANASAFIDWVGNKLSTGEIVTMAILDYSGPLNLVSGHAYTVVRVDTLPDGSKQVVVRNPWGMDGNRCDDGTNDGYVTLSAAEAFSAIDSYVSAKAA